MDEPQYKTCGVCRERSRKWKAEHPERSRELGQNWRDNNREKARKSARAWRADNLKKKRESNRNWNKSNPLNRNILTHNYEARKRDNGGTFTFKELNALFEKQEGYCFYCGELLYSSFDKDVHIEHKIPVSRGGSNDISNIALSCSKCNLQKGTKTHEEFLKKVRE